MKKYLAIFFLLFAFNAEATTYYVRPGGGTCADITSSYVQDDDNGGEQFHGRQCTGLANVDYDGSGEDEACACNNLQWLIHTNGGVATADMSGGDTVIITGPIQVGCGINGTACQDWEVNINDSSKCHSTYTDTCYMTPVPSGTDSTHKTKIYGAGWDTGCSSPAEIWGVGQVEKIINLLGSDNVDLRCLKLTDHATCASQAPNGADSCVKSTSDLSAADGIQAHGSSDIELHDITIWGVGHNGFDTGSITDWTLDNVLVKYTGWTGFEMDRGHNAGDTEMNGTFSWTDGGIQYAGCSDDYPNDAPKNCVGQNQGIAADAFGTYEIGGDFYFDGVDISHNQGDGLDLLYHRLPTHVIHIRNSKFEGNAGNQLKLAGGVGGTITVENSQIIGNCSYFQGKSFQLYDPAQPGRSGTNCDNDDVCDANENYSNAGCSVDTGGDCATATTCRAGGDSIAIDWATGMDVKIYNTTIAGSDDGYILWNANNYYVTTPCDGTEVFQLRNILMDGTASYSPGLFGVDHCATLSPDIDYTAMYASRITDSGCTGYTHKSCTDTKLTGFVDGIFDASIASDSPAIGQGLTSITCDGDCTVDYNNFARGASWDIGALEYGSTPTEEETPASYSLTLTGMTLTGVTIK